MNDTISKEDAIELAKLVAKKLWDEGKISYKWDNVKDVEFLADIIQNQKMVEND